MTTTYTKAGALGIGVAVLALLMVASTAFAAGQPAAPGQNKLTCSADAPAACTVEKSGKAATIDTTAGGGAAAVYLSGFNTSFYGVRTSEVTTLSNTVSGDTLGIDPRWSIPLDTNHDGNTDLFAFAAFADCNNGAGLVDVINDPTCTIYRDGVAYPNWTAMVTANTNDYISLNDYYAFIIADGSGAPGTWTISNMKVGKPGK